MTVLHDQPNELFRFDPRSSCRSLFMSGIRKPEPLQVEPTLTAAATFG